MYMNDEMIKIWCTYHNENILKEYNLFNTSHIQLFNDDDRTLSEDNINYLHDYVGDMSTYYYVWKNAKKSDYVGFCQYRRHFSYIDYDALEKNGVCCFQLCKINDNNTIYNEYNKYVNDYFMLNFINYMYYTYNKDVKDYIFKDNSLISFHSMFIFRWDIFNEVAEFIFGFLSFLTNNKWKNESSLIYLSKFWDYKNINSLFTQTPTEYIWKRAYSVINEFIIGMFVNIMYNIEIKNKDHEMYFISYNDTIKNLETFERWYKINIKTGIKEYYLNEANINILKKLLNGTNKSIGEKFPNIIEYIPQEHKEIKLTNSQIINCEDSIEFHKGNYNIINI